MRTFSTEVVILFRFMPPLPTPASCNTGWLDIPHNPITSEGPFRMALRIKSATVAKKMPRHSSRYPLNPSATPKREGCPKRVRPETNPMWRRTPPDENSLASNNSLRILTVFGDAQRWPTVSDWV
jgi:hypothetical protein